MGVPPVNTHSAHGAPGKHPYLKFLFAELTFVDRVTLLRNNRSVDYDQFLPFCRGLGLHSAKFWRLLRRALESHFAPESHFGAELVSLGP